MKLAVLLLLSPIISTLCRAQDKQPQHLYSAIFAGCSQKGIISGTEIGYERGYIVEFSAYTHPAKFAGGGDDSKNPNILMLKGGFMLRLRQSNWYISALAGACYYNIQQVDIASPTKDFLPVRELMPAVGLKIAYSIWNDGAPVRIFMDDNYIKDDASIAFGIIFSFNKTK